MKMQKAEMEFVRFDTQDVIATSGGGGPAFTFLNLADGNIKNAVIMFNGETIYDAAKIDPGVDDAESVCGNGAWENLDRALGSNALPGSNDTLIYNKDLSASRSIYGVFGDDGKSSNENSGADWLNGVFEWLNGAEGWGFYKQ